MSVLDRVLRWLLLAGGHRYLSTACLHDRHGHCRSDRALSGASKVPHVCKFCSARCVCRCHRHGR